MVEHCPDCGEAVDSDDRFCYYCGEGLARTEGADTSDGYSPRYCIDCGEPAERGDKYCYFCGEPLQ
jgi:predicted nucleic acid-binding Zn ribbon protein